jgi:nicotinamidase-related amidase
MPDSDFPIIPARTAMLFFDTYNAALHPADPARAARAAEWGVIPKLQRINEACRAAGIPVFYAQADHRPDLKDFTSHVVDVLGDQPREKGPYRTKAPGVSAGSKEVEIIPEIAPQPGDYVIKKIRWSAFHQTRLDGNLRVAGIDTILLAGGAIEVGVASTAYSARDLGYSQVILSDACTARDREGWRFYMEKVFPHFARVRTVEEAIGLFGK